MNTLTAEPITDDLTTLTDDALQESIALARRLVELYTAESVRRWRATLPVVTCACGHTAQDRLGRYCADFNCPNYVPF